MPCLRCALRTAPAESILSSLFLISYRLIIKRRSEDISRESEQFFKPKTRLKRETEKKGVANQIKNAFVSNTKYKANDYNNKTIHCN